MGEDGEPMFVAADLLSTLNLDRKALERLDDDEKGVSSIHTPGGRQEMTRCATSPTVQRGEVDRVSPNIFPTFSRSIPSVGGLPSLHRLMP